MTAPQRQSQVRLSQILVSVLTILWVILLIAPAATTYSAAHEWDINNHLLFAASCAAVIVLCLALPGKVFFLLSYPLALLGIACMAADLLRQVDLLELIAQWRSYSRAELNSALRPYVFATVAAAALLGAVAWFCCRSGSRASLRDRYLAAALILLLAGAALPGAVWPRAWPLNAVLVVASTIGNSHAWAPLLFPNSASVNPRDPAAHWRASRIGIHPDGQNETYVFVIGESVRSDSLHECGGPVEVSRVVRDALVACDVTAGSDATHTSVPLLISRELPGHRARVSSDASFLHAFSEVGFDTYWYSVQGQAIAWPDAQHESYDSAGTLDRTALLPLLAWALSQPNPRKTIVLHANNAHDPYCARFEMRTAAFRAACPGNEKLPDKTTIPVWRTAYANAVDESVRFLNEIIGSLEKQPGQAFLVYTPDHGENLLDDQRNLFQHALRHPTRWDIQVPAVFWANQAWRRAHPMQWAVLTENVEAPLTHADMVPTLLGAASIQYEEPRRTVTDLLSAAVPSRHRLIQPALGSTIDWEVLVREAREAAR